MPKISEWGTVSIYPETRVYETRSVFRYKKRRYRVYINTRGEHNPPHFHAVSGEWEAAIRIGDFSVMVGKLPPCTRES